MKRLYVAHKVSTIYVLAEDNGRLHDKIDDAFHDAEKDYGASAEIDFDAITHKPTALEGSWDKNCLVYGADNDTMLGDVIDKLPEK